MGADTFDEIHVGTNLPKVFARAVETAAWEYGHGGYTGTVAEKDSYVVLSPPEGIDPNTWVDWIWAAMDYQMENEARRNPKTGRMEPPKKPVPMRVQTGVRYVRDATAEDTPQALHKKGLFMQSRTENGVWRLVVVRTTYKRIPEQYVDWLLEHYAAVDDKWGPAGVVDITESKKGRAVLRDLRAQRRKALAHKKEQEAKAGGRVKVATSVPPVPRGLRVYRIFGWASS